MSLLRICAMTLFFALLAAPIRAQLPIDLPALPDPVPMIASPVVPRSVVASTNCTPGHCQHRGMIRRRQCKRHLQEVFLGYPEEFERPELGSMLHNVNRIQVGNATAASLVLYQFDFEAGTPRLNPRGRDKLAVIAAKLPTTFAPVIVERTGVPEFDEQRRLVVLEGLAANAFPIPSERVIVAPAISRGLRGDEAFLIHEILLARTLQSGPPVGVGFDSPSPAAR